MNVRYIKQLMLILFLFLQVDLFAETTTVTQDATKTAQDLEEAIKDIESTLKDLGYFSEQELAVSIAFDTSAGLKGSLKYTYFTGTFGCQGGISVSGGMQKIDTLGYNLNLFCYTPIFLNYFALGGESAVYYSSVNDTEEFAFMTGGNLIFLTKKFNAQVEGFVTFQEGSCNLVMQGSAGITFSGFFETRFGIANFDTFPHYTTDVFAPELSFHFGDSESISKNFLVLSGKLYFDTTDTIWKLYRYNIQISLGIPF